MKIIVTGAAGFIGSHLAERLAAARHEVIGIDSFNAYYSPALKQTNAAAAMRAGAKIIQADLVEADLKPIVAGAEIVYHFAAQPGIDARVPLEQYVRDNITATHHLLEALPRTALVVNIATSSVYGAHATDSEDAPPKPTSYYGVTKLAAEQLVLAYHRDRGQPACSMRLFSVYGPRERPDKLYPKLAKALCEDTPLPLFEGSEKHARSFTYVGDVIDAMARVPVQGDKVIGEIFNIGSDQENTTGEAIAIAESIVGKKVQINRQPRRPGDQTRTSANIEKARRVLAYNPRTTLREGLERTIDWYHREIMGLRIPNDETRMTKQ